MGALAVVAVPAGHGWTVPNLLVLPGELICDTLERLCCQHLRIDGLACP